MAKTKAKAPRKVQDPGPANDASTTTHVALEKKPNLRLEWRSPAELAENPKNWRRHPDAQVQALTDTISEVGWAGACLYNERTGRLIDGHARRKVALEQGTDQIPVLVGDWSEADEAKILATLDPLAAMANADAQALKALLADVTSQSGPVNKMLEDLVKSAGPVFDPNMAPESASEPVTAADVEAAADEAGDVGGSEQELKQVTCPQCAHDFMVDPNQFK